MRRHTIILIVVLAMLIGALLGCACTKPKPEIVYVPTYQPPPPLQMPQAPEWQTCEADPADWQAYLQAMTEDLLNSWAYIAELEHVIGAYNESRSEPE
jgi:ABC-type uncharacterized transport system auxiliary subunit